MEDGEAKTVLLRTTTTSSPELGASGKAPDITDPRAFEEHARRAAATGENLTKQQCLALTSAERLALVNKGALIFDGLKQTAFLEGVISSLNAEEFMDARRSLATATIRGNLAAQGVWDSLWKQAGRLNAVGTLTDFGNHKSRSDARHVMEGWFETDPDAATAWAKEKSTQEFPSLEAAAVGYALKMGAGGDPDKLLESLSTLSPGETVLKKWSLNSGVWFFNAGVSAGLPFHWCRYA